MNSDESVSSDEDFAVEYMAVLEHLDVIPAESLAVQNKKSTGKSVKLNCVIILWIMGRANTEIRYLWLFNCTSVHLPMVPESSRIRIKTRTSRPSHAKIITGRVSVRMVCDASTCTLRSRTICFGGVTWRSITEKPGSLTLFHGKRVAYQRMLNLWSAYLLGRRPSLRYPTFLKNRGEDFKGGNDGA